MFKKIKLVTIYKPNDVATFEVGRFLIFGKVESKIVVETISLGYNSVSIHLSNGGKIIFKKLPFSYEY